jgi:hypothetical protein
VQVCVLYAAILADIFVTAYTDTLHTTEVLTIILLLRCAGPNGPTQHTPPTVCLPAFGCWRAAPTPLLLLLLVRAVAASAVRRRRRRPTTNSLQVFLLLAIVLAFFIVTTSSSPYVKLGLYNKYLRQHRAVFALSLIALVLVGCVGAYRLVSVLVGVLAGLLAGVHAVATPQRVWCTRADAPRVCHCSDACVPRAAHAHHITHATGAGVQRARVHAAVGAARLPGAVDGAAHQPAAAAVRDGTLDRDGAGCALRGGVAVGGRAEHDDRCAARLSVLGGMGQAVRSLYRLCTTCTIARQPQSNGHVPRDLYRL